MYGFSIFFWAPFHACIFLYRMFRLGEVEWMGGKERKGFSLSFPCLDKKD